MCYEFDKISCLLLSRKEVSPARKVRCDIQLFNRQLEIDNPRFRVTAARVVRPDLCSLYTQENQGGGPLHRRMHSQLGQSRSGKIDEEDRTAEHAEDAE